MPKVYMGEVRNGVVVFDEGVTPPCEGTRVRMEAMGHPTAPGSSEDDPMAATRAWLLAAAREAEADPESHALPADLAEQHDHYAHGRPLP